MIIPVRCFTCGKVVGDKYLKYLELVKENKDAQGEENTDTIITATFDVDPKELDDLMARCKPLIDGALEEEGCQDYSWTLDPYVPGRIWVMERWESEEALKKHFDDEWYKNMGATLNEVGLLNAFSAKYKISKQEPVYDDTGTPRADFFSD